MRRRTGAARLEVPPRLAAFDPAHWRTLVVDEPPDGTVDFEYWLDNAALAEWERARERWAEQHGWPPGDVVDRLRDRVAARRALAANHARRAADKAPAQGTDPC